MKKKYVAMIGALSVLLAGCGEAAESTSQVENTDTVTAESSEEEIADAVETSVSADEGLTDDYLITNVYGDGQKAWIVVLEYASEIDPASVSAEDYTVDDYDIEAVYVNTEAEIPEESTAGTYVLIELSTDYTTSNYGGSGSTSSSDSSEEVSSDTDASDANAAEEISENSSEEAASDAVSGSSEEANLSEGFGDGSMSADSGSSDGTGFGGGMMDGGAGGFGGAEAAPSNELTVTFTQTGNIESTDGTVYEASETAYTTDYEDNDNLLVQDFTQDTYTLSDGTELMYNLYLPEDYDENTEYAVVLFMPDATGEGDDEYLTLTESLGAVVWTTDYDSENSDVIVLAPQYTEDNTEDPAYTMELLEYIIEQYSVDEDRLYLVGQSSGTIRSLKLLIDYPDTFAAAMLVAGQADDDYTDLISQLSDQTIWMISSAGDERAYPGMQAIVDAVEAEGTQVTTSQWSADLSDEEQEELAQEQEAAGTSINWTIFDAGTVMEDDVEVSAVTEHMNTWRVAYNLDTIRDWLLAQSK